MSATWKRYEELRPDQLTAIVAESPVAFWPLGLLEHHGWHLPVGFDGLKAERVCRRIAARTGGVLLPTLWWGWGGGHDRFKWTHYQEESTAASAMLTTTRQLLGHGFRAILLLAGHYPWQSLMDKHLPSLREEHPDALLLWGTEMSICGDAVRIPGDHAAREETSYGLALLPELVDLDALSSGRDDSTWPQGQPPPVEDRHPGVCFDPSEPLFAQMGQDARTASSERGEEGISQVVDYLAVAIDRFLKNTDR